MLILGFFFMEKIAGVGRCRKLQEWGGWCGGGWIKIFRNAGCPVFGRGYICCWGFAPHCMPCVWFVAFCLICCRSTFLIRSFDFIVVFSDEKYWERLFYKRIPMIVFSFEKGNLWRPGRTVFLLKCHSVHPLWKLVHR